MWMKLIAEKYGFPLGVPWICLPPEKGLLPWVRSVSQPRNTSKVATMKKPQLFQESSGTGDILTPSLSAPSSVLLTGSLIHSLDQNGGIRMSQRTEPQLDSGRENQHVATGRSCCLSSLSRTHRLTGLPGLVPPPPQAPCPLDLLGSAHISLREARLMTWLYFLHGTFHLRVCAHVFTTCSAA